MSDEKIKAKLDQVKGGIKQVVGKATENKKLEAKGMVEKTIAKGKEIVDDIKEGSEGAVDSIKKALDKKK
ncbi:CsbD-like protein [Streptococcus infantarius subsp. infantarius]|uniref:CsbD-like protein n=2 Tax=Streptococcus infantarius TaxID=102684 RepID=A0A380KR32_9STRE|nr:CsbD family protein [Streptococcus infantarius]MCO4466758.1 CsbD-like protein [Streptococcus infantarius subsp. infantarius]EDT47872.1 CsbD-like protein [Streptococcus infantarius subsp. infantarius ATCC BAA-102]MCO4468672.1 CsbD-like protein [Streptococcus infantarius subsp. infantarius]MCO4640333.1 CsbD-like protein [Streptococcus infantarius subsp. infantarius]MCO4646229.1 CsbD-like protein [Streptococcus infantarius subsp. infantarius]